MTSRATPASKLAPGHLAPTPSYGLNGIDRHDWEDAEFLQRLSSELQRKVKLPDQGLPDTPDSAALLIRATARVPQIFVKRVAARCKGYYRVHAAARVPDFNAGFLRYRKCGNHRLALVPGKLWLRSIQVWDDHALAVSLMLGIELPHPRARRDQDLLKFAFEFYACFEGVFGLKPSQLYREHAAFIAEENKRLANKTKLLLATFNRRIVENLLSWFPRLAGLNPTQIVRQA